MTEPIKFPKPRKFNTMEEMMSHWYPSSVLEEIQKADDPLLSSVDNWWSIIYGAKVWQQLNYEANPFAILPKKPWRQSGWRVETEKPSNDGGTPLYTGGVAENASPLTSDSLKPDWLEVSAGVKSIWHHFELSDVAEFYSTVDDSISAKAEMRESLGKWHVEVMNRMLMQDVGDVSAQATDIESIDRVVSSNAEAGLVDANDADIYGVDRDAAASWADSVVTHNSDTNQPLTLKLIDDTLQALWSNGAKPKVILTGYDTLMEWSRLLETQRRFMPAQNLKFTSFNGVQPAAPGVEAGFAVSEYFGIPIIPTQYCFNGGDGISHIYFLDTDHLFLKVAMPTQYIEQSDPLAIDRFGSVGGFYTMAELICTNFRFQGKIRDLEAA
jgi:hypothetical protein